MAPPRFHRRASTDDSLTAKLRAVLATLMVLTALLTFPLLSLGCALLIPSSVRWPAIAVIIVFYIGHQIVTNVVSPLHRRGGNRSYAFTRSTFFRSILTDHFLTECHFDSEVTRSKLLQHHRPSSSSTATTPDKENEEGVYNAMGEAEIAAARSDAMFPSGKSYLFGVGPHGVIGVAVWSTYLCIADEINAVFCQRNFRVNVHTMTANFFLPLWREFLLSCGFCDVTKEGLEGSLVVNYDDGDDKPQQQEKDENNKTNNKKKDAARNQNKIAGQVSVVVPGGATESLFATQVRMHIANRVGFCKVALDTGSMLVPVFNFGEIGTFFQVFPDSLGGVAPRWVWKVLDIVGVGLPLTLGKWCLPALPMKTKVDVVIGEPFDPRTVVAKLRRSGGGGSMPTSEESAATAAPHHPRLPSPPFARAEVKAVHDEFCRRMKDLYARYAPVFARPGDPEELVIT